jgi:hypothetical protein
MKIRSPFDGLKMSQELASEFFAAFSRFEYMLKEHKYVQKGSTSARPDWDRFARDAAARMKLEAGTDVAEAVAYLNANPPQVQMATLVWQETRLAGDAPVERAFQAARRIRNNLFHGGKHTLDSPAGRDEKLVRSSLRVMYAFLEQNGDWRSTYGDTD